MRRMRPALALMAACGWITACVGTATPPVDTLATAATSPATTSPATTGTGTGTSPATTPTSPATTPTSPAATPTSPAATPTSPAATGSAPAPPANVEYEMSDCSTPPVPFALLCDVYDLIARHHVEAPLDPAALAAGAAVGASGFEPADLTEGAPASFVCAVPDPAFGSICDVLAEGLARGGFPIEEALDAAVASMITLSLDPFTFYVPPELSGALTEDGIVSDVGLLLTISDAVGSTCAVVEAGCRLEVVLAVDGGPAQTAGVLAGDVVTAIDGEPVGGSTLIDVAGALAGSSGSRVTVTIDRNGAASDIGLERDPSEIPGVVVEVPAPGVGYLRIPDFEVDIPRLVHTALGSLSEQGVERIVVDLRDNPGGYVDVATLVASEFLADGVVFRSQGREEELEYPVQDGGLATSGVSLTVVVNGGSASAAEIVASVLQERGRATVVGSPTLGKNTVQIGFPLRNDGLLRVTIARWTTPEGASVAIDGVIPDVIADIPSDASPGEVVELAGA